jgi:hypothetical protein
MFEPQHYPSGPVPMPVPANVPAATSSAAIDALTDIIAQVQQLVLRNDVRAAAKVLKHAREKHGRSAELASLTCQVRLLLGRKQAAKKACYAALTIPFLNQDAYWKSAAFDGLAALFEALVDIEGAIQASRMALKNLDRERRGHYYLRVIQLLGRRGACADLHEAQRIAQSGTIPGPQLAVVRNMIHEWSTTQHGQFCDYSHLPPAVRRFVLHPEEAMKTAASADLARYIASSMADSLPHVDGGKEPTINTAATAGRASVDVDQLALNTQATNLGVLGVQDNAWCNASNVSSSPTIPILAGPALVLSVPQPPSVNIFDDTLSLTRLLDQSQIEESAKMVRSVMQREMQRVSAMRFDDDIENEDNGKD